MVAMHVHRQLNNALVQRLDNLGQSLVIDTIIDLTVFLVINDSQGKSIDQSLNGSCSVKVQGDLDHVGDDTIDNHFNSLGV